MQRAFGFNRQECMWQQGFNAWECVYKRIASPSFSCHSFWPKFRLSSLTRSREKKMAKPRSLSLLASLCFLSAIVIAVADPKFIVEGKVYCDNCRVGFITRASRYIEGAKVMIECQNLTSTRKTFSGVGVTDKSGTYSVEVPDRNTDEDCRVTLLSSPDRNCKERKAGSDVVDMLLTNDIGMESKIRHAQPLGFLRAKPLQVCREVLMELSGDY